MSRLALDIEQSHLALLMERAQVSAIYKGGALHTYQKLPLKLGATIALYPALLSDWLTITIPFRDIRGDRTGFLAGSLTRVLWGFLSDQIKQRLQPALAQHGLDPAPLGLEQITLDDGSKAALVRYPLASFNNWLSRRSQPVGLHLSEFECHHQGVHLAFTRS